MFVLVLIPYDINLGSCFCKLIATAARIPNQSFDMQLTTYKTSIVVFTVCILHGG